MNPSALQLIQQGLVAHEAGDERTAEAAYEKALQLEPNHSEALRLMGVLRRQQKKFQEAREYFLKALAQSEHSAQLHHDYALLEFDCGDLGNAVAHYCKALQLDRRSPETFFNLGNAYKALGHVEEAKSCFEKAIQLAPHLVEANYNAAVCYQETNAEKAKELYKKTLELKPDHANAMQNLALIYKNENKNELAQDLFQKALQIHPGSTEAMVNLAIVFMEKNQFSEAETLLHRAMAGSPSAWQPVLQLSVLKRKTEQHEAAFAFALKAKELAPANPEIYTNLGLLYQQQFRYGDAEAQFRRALELAPERSDHWSNLATILVDERKFDEALEACDKAVASPAPVAEAYYGRAWINLLLGRYAAAWEDYEWRIKLNRGEEAFAQLTMPRWQGEPLAGKTILVCSEQGFGDIIQFARYVPLLIKRGAQVILQCPPALERVMPSLSTQLKIITDLTGVVADYYLPIMSLGTRFGSTARTVPNSVPYLAPPVDQELQLPPAEAAHKKIGIVWAANIFNVAARHRSLRFHQLERIFSLPGATYYSLQVGEFRKELLQATPRSNVHDLAPLLDDFAVTAKAITHMDLVLSVDTSVAHLAGALGRPVWLLLPYANDWRWMIDREDSIWYPTMRIIRQHAPGDWASALTKLEQELKLFISNK